MVMISRGVEISIAGGIEEKEDGIVLGVSANMLYLLYENWDRD